MFIALIISIISSTSLKYESLYILILVVYETWSAICHAEYFVV